MLEINNFGKLLIMTGAILILAGLIFNFSGKITCLGKLPGDIYIQKGNLTFFFPVATSILISVILSIIFYFFSRR